MPAKKIKKKIVKKVVKKVAKKKASKVIVVSEKDVEEAETKPELTKDPFKQPRESGKPYKYAEYLIFIDWVATPRVDRNPEKQKEFSKKFGVNHDTLAEWKKKVEFWDEVRAVRNRDLLDRTGDVLRRLEIVSLTGDVAAIKLYLQYTNQLVENKEETLTAPKELLEALAKMNKALPD